MANAQAYTTRKISHSATGLSIYFSRFMTASQAPRLIFETMIVVGFLVLAGYYSLSQNNSQKLIEILGIFGMAGMRVMPTLSRLLYSINDVRKRTIYIDVLHGDMIDIMAGRSHGQTDAVERQAFAREVAFNAVGYRYPGTEEVALSAVTFSIGKGDSIGIVGSSGAGKSTLIDLLLGLLEPTEGSILVDGRDIGENKRGWRAIIGFVPQNFYILDDTVRRNVAFGVDDEEIDEARIAQALAVAHVQEFVAGLPDGLETMLGEGGSRLSGGQRQRIAIARALYKNPDILVFDEATSALDNETEADIAAALRSLAGVKTMIIIAHRLSTVRHCDRLIFLDKGRIKAVGRFDELMRDCEAFANLVRLGALEQS